ncbi:MAG: hypothetical protein NZZ41_00235 [Candidatus Dojkabacteria bacterium]|nr:hypothetical protein [Candidatus Dojkabacteria bacterium]
MTETNKEDKINKKKSLKNDIENAIETISTFSYIDLNIRENIKNTLKLRKYFDERKSLEELKKEFEESKFIIWNNRLFLLTTELLNYLYSQRLNKNIIIFDHYDNPVLVKNPKNLWLYFNTYYQNICFNYYTKYVDTLESLKENLKDIIEDVSQEDDENDDFENDDSNNNKEEDSK